MVINPHRMSRLKKFYVRMLLLDWPVSMFTTTSFFVFLTVTKQSSKCGYISRSLCWPIGWSVILSVFWTRAWMSFRWLKNVLVCGWSWMHIQIFCLILHVLIIQFEYHSKYHRSTAKLQQTLEIRSRSPNFWLIIWHAEG